VATALAGVGAQAGNAGDFVFCGGSTEQPFTQWNDDHQYRLVPGGDFESGATGWTLSGGAKIVPGNESFMVRGGGYSLYLPSGSSATSPPVCAGLTDPNFRYFLAETGASSGYLAVDVYYRTVLGLLPMSARLGSDAGTSTWAPSQTYGTALSRLLGSLNLNLTAGLQFRFTPKSSSFFAPASYRIDDVYVDPYGLGNSGD
jgi:hypothetical protein